MKFKKPKIAKKKIVIFSVFLFIATIFWFLNALNREYTTKIDYPISYYNFPKNVISSTNSPDALSITIKAYGFDILWNLGVTKPMDIDIQNYAIIDKNDKTKLVINTNKLREEFFPEIPDINILNIKPDNITFLTKKIFSKKVPVKLNINYSEKELFMQSAGINISPDSISIYAPKEDLEKYSFVESEYEEFSELDDSLNTTLKLKKIKNVNFSNDQVNLLIPIEKYTEKTTNVIIAIENCPDSLRLITFPKESKITYRVTLNRFDSISSNDFKLIVDYKDLGTKPDKLQIQVKERPQFIQSVKLSPEFLEYVLEKSE